MANAALLGDMADACPLTPPAPIVSGSATVLINGVPCALLGSTVANGSTVVGGSGTVLVEGQPLARVGDSTTCGVIIGAGSPTVLVG